MEGNTTSSKAQRCAVVTGAYRGIGVEICCQLASNGITVILTARNEKKSPEAVDKLKGLGLSNVIFHQLDITDPASIATLTEYVQNQFGKLDILVNNAGVPGIADIDVTTEECRAFALGGAIATDDKADMINKFIKQTYEATEECVKTNYYGTKGVTEALLPLLQLSNSPRIVNISSIYGELKYIHNEKVKEELRNVDGLTEEKIDEIVQWYLRDFKEDKFEANGWPITMSAYKVSKAAISAYTRVIAKKFPKFRVNCVHPGYVKTEITFFTGMLTPEEGARAPVMLALLPDDGPTGLYFREKQPGPM